MFQFYLIKDSKLKIISRAVVWPLTLHHRQVSKGTGGNGCHAAGLKQEVATALRALRDKLLAEQKEKEVRGRKEWNYETCRRLKDKDKKEM